VKVLLIDNYDSFTHNLAQALGKLGAHVDVVRNDAITIEAIEDADYTHIVLSPGPGHPGVPRDFGVCAAVITRIHGRIPTLGVCLGHQGIAHHLGGRVVRAPQIVHGKMHTITHTGDGLFAGLPSRIEVMRYHSLVVERESLPAALEVTASTDDGLIMAMRHREVALVGVQFHPESIGTPTGEAMLGNFLSGR
jgi:anthranilate synthase component 2